MMLKFIAKTAVLAIALLMLSGCDESPVGKPYTVEATISDVQFVAAHGEEHCSKVCDTYHIPDRWYLNVCAKYCYDMRLDHPPWDWQQKGQKVTATLQNWSGNDTSLEDIAKP